MHQREHYKKRGIRPAGMILPALLMAFIFALSLNAFAYTASVKVRVEGSNGEVNIAPLDDSPAVTPSSVRLKDREETTFNFESDMPASYRYKIWQTIEDNKVVTYDKTIYFADIFFEQKDDKSIVAYTVLLKEGSDSKSEEVVFTNTPDTDLYGDKVIPDGDKEPDETEKDKDKDKKPDNNEDTPPVDTTNTTGKPVEQVKTGDDTNIWLWVWVMVMASAVIAYSVIRTKKAGHEEKR